MGRGFAHAVETGGLLCTSYALCYIAAKTRQQTGPCKVIKSSVRLSGFRESADGKFYITFSSAPRVLRQIS